jgi:uncharacterized membrane protein ArfC
VNHVHWWLFALSFAVGLVLTLALLVRQVKRQVPVGKSEPTESEPTTTKIPVPKEPPTTRIRVSQRGTHNEDSGHRGPADDKDSGRQRIAD